MTLAFRTSLLQTCCAVTFATLFSTSVLHAQSAPAKAWGAASPLPAAVDGTSSPDRAAAYYHYGLARIYEDEASANGRQDLASQAIEQYKLALDADSNSRELQDGLANLYFKLGRIREAVSAAQDQVTKHPEDVDAHILLGRVYLRSLGDGQGPQSTDMLQAAIKEYETIARLKPDDLETHLLLGQLYGLNHDSAKAEAEFKLAQKLDPQSEEVVLSIARLYTEQGDLAKAAKVIADVPVDDRSGRMDFALAGIYDQLKKPKEAVAAYRATLDQDPDNTDAKRGLANALVADGQTNAAAKVFADLLVTDPQDAQSLIREADLQRQQGHYELALSTLKKASALVSDNLELEYNEALCYDALGQFDDAIKTLKGMLAATIATDGKYSDQDRSNRALFLGRLGIVQNEAGNTVGAVDAYQQMMALGGEAQAQGADGLVDTYRQAHDWTAATKAASDAAKAMPDNHEVQLTYARQLADSGKVDEGIKLAEAQLKGTPDDREVYYTISDINVRAKRFKDATAALDKVETLSSKPAEKSFFYYYRGSVAEQQKMFDQAEEDFKKGLAIDPDSAAIDNDYGYMLADRGIRLDEAVTMIKKAVDFDPQNGAYLDSLAWVYYKQGQYALAEDYARKAVARLNSDPAVHDHLGEIYAKNGKLPMAVAEWQKATALYATSLPPEADPADVAKVQHKLEGARVKLAHLNAAPR